MDRCPKELCFSIISGMAYLMAGVEENTCTKFEHVVLKRQTLNPAVG